jgi:branched-chain amino acid transport system ATP-binding protein
LLSIENLHAYYGDIQALWGVSLRAEPGTVVTIVGANAAGKTTTLKCISGLIRKKTGRISFEGRPIEQEPAHHIVDLGIVQIPEGRQLFPFMSVQENLELGAYSFRAKASKARSLEMVYELLPVLKARRKQLAGSLSGGEQQMCAIARGLMATPKLLMLDEPSLGLAPIIVQEVFALITTIRQQGTTVLLVEQNVRHALSTADRGYVLENGRVVLEGPGADLLQDDRLTKAYLGV